MVKRHPPGRGAEPPGGRARSRLEQFEFMHGRELDDVEEDIEEDVGSDAEEPTSTDDDWDGQRTESGDEPHQRLESKPSNEHEPADD